VAQAWQRLSEERERPSDLQCNEQAASVGAEKAGGFDHEM